MPKREEVGKASPVRAVILPGTIGVLGSDDENHVDPLLGGLTVAWIPGDHGITIMLGGYVQNGVQQEPALTAFITAQSVQRILRRGFPNELGHISTMLEKLGEPTFDLYGEPVDPLYEWWEEYIPGASDELGGLGYFSGYVHCMILGKGDPLKPAKPLKAYHSGLKRETGKPSRTKDFQYADIGGLISTWELFEGVPLGVGGDSWRPNPARKFVLRFAVPEMIQVFLTAEEVDDLLIVLRYQPAWLT